MKSACNAFRSLLEQKLTGRPDPSTLRTLSWHEHLLGCGDCRRLLEDEEALEGLLATLPDPRLSPEIRRRVLVALARSRGEDAALDRLLELDREAVAPAGLARDVLARLEQERAMPTARRAEDPLEDLLNVHDRVDVPANLAGNVLGRLEAHRNDAARREGRLVDARLDALLERADHVGVPAGLSARVLRGLRHERAAVSSSGRERVTTGASTSTIVSTLRPTRFVRSVWVLAAAAGLVAAIAAWSLWPRHDATPSPVAGGGSNQRHDANGSPTADERADPNSPTNRAQGDLARAPDARHALVDGSNGANDPASSRTPDAQMLAAMDVLENWDYLMQSDVDVLLSTVEPADEALLDYQEGG